MATFCKHIVLGSLDLINNLFLSQTTAMFGISFNENNNKQMFLLSYRVKFDLVAITVKLALYIKQACIFPKQANPLKCIV